MLQNPRRGHRLLMAVYFTPGDQFDQALLILQKAMIALDPRPFDLEETGSRNASFVHANDYAEVLLSEMDLRVMTQMSGLRLNA